MTEPAARGRPRDPRAQQQILAAARTLLARDGYEQLSIEQIARAAGVSRPTVYRRWPSKAHIVFDAAFGDGRDAEFPPRSGDFATDLHTFVGSALSFWSDPVVSAAALGILSERHRNPDLSIRTQQLLDESTGTTFAELVRSGIDQGAVRADVDIDMLYHLLIGTAFYLAHMGGGQRSERSQDDTRRLCALVLDGAARTPRRKAIP